MGVPVATPTVAAECLAAARAVRADGAERVELEREVAGFLAIPHVRAANLGRAALYFLLEAMKRGSRRNEVIVPAYICPSVGRSVIKAGLKPVLCDVGEDGSGLDVAHLEQRTREKTLAIIAAHLFGYPADMEPVVRVARRIGAMTIEDGAQAFSAKWRGRFVGGAGDAAIFSFGMSKVLGTAGGGLIVTSLPELAADVAERMSRARAQNSASQAMSLLKLAVVGWLTRRRHLGPIAALWASALRGKGDCADFAAAPLPPSNARLIRALLRRSEDITRIRSRNAAYYAAHLAQFRGLTLPRIQPGAEPVYLRFPIVVEDPADKRKLVVALRKRGINCSEMYSRESYDQLRGLTGDDTPCPRAEHLCERMLNLPTHPFVKECDLVETVRAFEAVLGRRDSRTAAAMCGAELLR